MRLLSWAGLASVLALFLTGQASAQWDDIPSIEPLAPGLTGTCHVSFPEGNEAAIACTDPALEAAASALASGPQYQPTANDAYERSYTIDFERPFRPDGAVETRPLYLNDTFEVWERPSQKCLVSVKVLPAGRLEAGYVKCANYLFDDMARALASLTSVDLAEGYQPGEKLALPVTFSWLHQSSAVVTARNDMNVVAPFDESDALLADAAKLGIDGACDLYFRLDGAGKAQGNVTTACSSALFEDAALEALKRLTFDNSSGEPTTTYSTIRLPFRYREQTQESVPVASRSGSASTPTEPVAASFTVPPQPVYPDRARANWLEGRCEVSAVPDADGVPGNISASCSDPIFEKSAQNAMKDARFDMSAGLRPGSKQIVPLEFRLDLSPLERTVFNRYAGARSTGRWDLINLDNHYVGAGRFTTSVISGFDEGLKIASGKKVPVYFEARAAARILESPGGLSLRVRGCSGGVKRVLVDDPIRESWKYKKQERRSQKRREKLVSLARRQKEEIRSFIAAQPYCSGYFLHETYTGEPYNHRNYLPADMLAVASKDNLVFSKYLFDFSQKTDAMKVAGSNDYLEVVTENGSVSLSDFSKFELLKQISLYKPQIEQRHPGFFSEEKATRRTAETSLANAFTYGDPDLLLWAVDLGLLHAPTVIAKYGNWLRDENTLSRLRSRGGDLNFTPDMMLAAFKDNDVSLMEAALERGMPIAGRHRGKRYDFFAEAVIYNKTRMFELIARYHDVNELRSGTSLLHLALPSLEDHRGRDIEWGFLDIGYTMSERASERAVEMLLEAGIDPDIRDSKGRTALEYYRYQFADQEKENRRAERAEARADAENRRLAREREERNQQAYNRLMGMAESAQQNFDNFARVREERNRRPVPTEESIVGMEKRLARDRQQRAERSAGNSGSSQSRNSRSNVRGSSSTSGSSSQLAGNLGSSGSGSSSRSSGSGSSGSPPTSSSSSLSGSSSSGLTLTATPKDDSVEARAAARRIEDEKTAEIARQEAEAKEIRREEEARERAEMERQKDEDFARNEAERAAREAQREARRKCISEADRNSNAFAERNEANKQAELARVPLSDPESYNAIRKKYREIEAQFRKNARDACPVIDFVPSKATQQ